MLHLIPISICSSSDSLRTHLRILFRLCDAHVPQVVTESVLHPFDRRQNHGIKNWKRHKMKGGKLTLQLANEKGNTDQLLSSVSPHLLSVSFVCSYPSCHNRICPKN